MKKGNVTYITTPRGRFQVSAKYATAEEAFRAGCQLSFIEKDWFIVSEWAYPARVFAVRK